MNQLEKIESSLAQLEAQVVQELLQPWWITLAPIGAVIFPSLALLILISWIIWPNKDNK